ncbi:MAG: hypothetical protein ACLFMO_06180 [Eubacteriales bacterium]
MNKKMTISLIITLLLMPLYLSINSLTTYAESNEDIEIEVTYGFEKNFKLGKDTPIIVEIENTSKDFDGEIEIEVPKTNNEYVLYTKEINLPKDSKKQVVIPVNILSQTEEIQVRLKDNKTVVAKEKLKISSGRLSSNTILIGVLSDDFNSLSYFHQQSTSNKIVLVKLDKEVLPDTVNGLEALDMIIINNYDTSSLTENQYNSLKQWLIQGRYMLIGTGPTYSKSLSVFDDEFLSGEILTSEKLETNFGYNEFSPIQLDIQNIRLKDGEDLFKDGAVKKIKKGNGYISIAMFDLGLEPISSWENNSFFAQELIDRNISEQYKHNLLMQENMDKNIYRIRDMLSVIPESKFQNTGKLVIIIILYIILIGPALYIVLKKLDKRYLIWIAVPVISFLFAFIIYYTSTSTRFNKPFINSGNIIKYNNEETSIKKTYTSIVSPYSSDLNIEIPAKYSIIPLSDNNYHSDIDNQRNNKKLHSKLRMEKEKTMIEIKDTGAFRPNYFTMESSYDFEGTVTTDLKFNNLNLEGTISNNLGFDLEDVFIYGGLGSFSEIGDLKQGDVKINQVLSKGHNVNVYNFVNILYPKRYNSITPNNNIEEEIIIRQRSSLIEYEFENYSYDDSNQFFIVGFTNEPLEENISINDQNFNQYETTMIIIPIELSFIDDKGKVDFPSGHFKPTVKSTSEMGDFDKRMNLMFGNNIELEYSIDEDIIVESIQFNRFNSNNADDFGGELYIYSYESNSYELFDYINDTLDEDEINKYLNENNRMLIKLIREDDNLENPKTIPEIKVKGRVR